MDNLAADFTIENNEPLTADFTIGENNIACNFEIYAAGTTWGSIAGNINNQTDLINILNDKVDLTSFNDLGETVTNNYDELSGDISDLTGTVSDNYSTLSGQISDLNTTVNNNYTSLDNRLTTAEGSVLNLTDTVSSNYTELNNKITANSNNIIVLNRTVVNNNTAINNRVDAIVESFNGDISDLSDRVTANSDDITTIQNAINTYGDIVTYNAAYFATANQGALADTALQPNDNISELVNNVGYITSASLPIIDQTFDGTSANAQSGVAIAGELNNYVKSEVGNSSISIDNNEIRNVHQYISGVVTYHSYFTASDYDAVIGTYREDTFGAFRDSSIRCSEGAAELYCEDSSDGYYTLGARADKIFIGNNQDSISLTISNSNLAINGTEVQPLLVSGTNIKTLNNISLLGNGDITIADLTTTAQLNALNSGATTTNIEQITTNANNIADLQTNKQNVILDLTTIRSNALAGKNASDTIATYGNIVTHNAGEFATSAQGSLADTALQPNDNISELTNDVGYITSASLPTVNNGTLDIQVNGTSIGTFTANQSGNTTANIVVPDSATWGNITGTLSNQTDLQTALNSKYDASNPNGYTSNIGTVTSVNNIAPVSGNVTINIPTDTADLTNGAGFITSADLPTNNVTTDTVQTITARKTFTGEKAIYFKQVATTNKLGFTLYNPSDTELGAFEYRPNTINGGALLNVNVPYSSSNYVGFRYWGTAVNVIAPKVTTAGNYFIPTHITDGNTTVTANSAGLINISSLLPSGGAVDSVNGQTGDVVLTASDVGALSDTTVIPTKTSDLTNDSGFINGITSSDVISALGYTPYNSSNPDSYTTSSDFKTINNTSIVGSGNITINEPILYSTTGQNTDGAMTQDATTSELNSINLSITSINSSLPKKLNINQVPPATFNAPNGVFTNSGNSITIKQGLRLTLPNGVNTDGTLNNTEYEVTEDITQAISPVANAYSTLFFSPNEPVGNKIAWFATKIYYIQDTEPFTPATGLYGIWYSRKDNTVRYTLNGSAWTDYIGIAIGTVKTDVNGNVTNIYPYTPIRIPDVSMVDGQWVASQSTFLNGVSLNATTYLDIDLSNYLPNDNYEYLVEISWSVYGAAFARMTFNTSFGSYIVNTHPRTSDNQYTDGCNKIVVGTNRIIQVRRSSGWSDTVTVSALGYRRLGTNA